jgi:hypothetical protein
MDSETWKAIPGLPRYEASNLGRIRSWCRIGRCQKGLGAEPRILATWVGKNPPYAFATIHDGDRQRGMLVHRLVLSAFAGECPPGMQGCHNDGDRLNNRLDNLRWDTVQQNHADKKRHGTYLCGEQSPVAKLTPEQVIGIREMRAAGAELKVVGECFHIPFQTVYNVCVGNSWLSVGGPIEPPRVKRPRKRS